MSENTPFLHTRIISKKISQTNGEDGIGGTWFGSKSRAWDPTLKKQMKTMAIQEDSVCIMVDLELSGSLCGP